MSAVIVYMTAKNAGEAQEIGAELISSGLAACINIIDPMQSMFHWQNEVQNEQETVLLAKTRADRLEELTARVLKIHSYDCPCIIALPIVGGNQDFINWIESETQQVQESE